jgi:hypothetical protein
MRGTYCSDQYSNLWFFATAKCALLILIGAVFTGCAGYGTQNALKAEKMEQGERLQHIIDNYRVCLHTKDNSSPLPRNCAI